MAETFAINKRQGWKREVIALQKIISGGQTGADQGGLFAARDLGLETGGWIPKGFKTEIGFQNWLEDFGLQETEDEAYPHRTYLNIKDADATILFSGRFMERGVSLTFNTAARLNKPLIRISLDDLDTAKGWNYQLQKTREWYRPEWKVLNIAGPRASRFDNVQDLVHNFLLRLLAPHRIGK